MRYVFLKNAFLLVVASLFVVGSLFVMVPAPTRENLDRVYFGYPIGFVTQDFAIEYQEGWYPPNFYFHPDWPYSLVWWRGIGSLVMVWGVLWGMVWLLERAHAPEGLRYLKEKISLRN